MLELIPTIATSFATAMATNSIKGAKGPAQALDDIMSLVGFEKLHFYAERKRAKNEVLIKDYKEKIAQELIKIPEENIQEPPLAIVGPALEASKFYIEEEELRNMFAKLIASSMNSANNDKTHPSFVEIIKQMSGVDAEIVKSFGNVNTHTVASIIENINIPVLNQKGYFRVIDYFYLLKNSDYTIETLCQSTSNIVRLGIISIDITQNKNEQDPFLSDSRVTEFISAYTPDNAELELQTSRLDVTPFGRAFMNCVF